MLEALEALAAEYAMFPKTGKILCAVSGGADSMCLVHYLHSRGLPLWVAHYNHQIRGKAAEEDSAFVADWCRQRGIGCTLGSGDVPTSAAQAGRGLEEMGREMRYAFLEETAAGVEASVIATAHHADDNAETLFLHLVRGTGLQGLTGIPPRRGNLIRPLLTTSRTEILDYVTREGVPFVEDATNRDVTYARNRLRQQVLPILREMNPNLTQGMNQTLTQLRQDNAFLNAQAFAHSRQAKWIGGSLVIGAAELGRQPDPIATRVARQLLQELGENQVSAAHLSGLVALARSTDPAARLDLPRGLVAQRVYDLIELTYDPETCQPLPTVPLQLEGETQVGNWIFTCHSGVAPSEPDGGCYLDKARVATPILVRGRQIGDQITLPKRGTKTVKKLLIDSKYPRGSRDALPLLVANDHVVYIPSFGPHAPDLAQPNQAAWVITSRKKDFKPC